jgi:hypothetical protein
MLIDNVMNLLQTTAKVLNVLYFEIFGRCKNILPNFVEK